MRIFEIDGVPYTGATTFFNGPKSSEKYSDGGDVMSPLRLETISVYKENETVVFHRDEIIDILYHLTFEQNEGDNPADGEIDYGNPKRHVKKATTSPITEVSRTKQGILRLKKGIRKNKNKFKPFRTKSKKLTKKKGGRR